MAYNVPTSGQWITFPVNFTRCSEIKWMENKEAHANTYYVTKCFWGPLETGGFTPTPPKELTADEKKALVKVIDVTSQLPKERPWPPGQGEPESKTADGKIKVLGCTDLFVAAEYYDEDFSGGGLYKYHIKDLAGSSKWISMRLNECFQYGQNGNFDNLRRFIVYHPVTPPRIFQHRFMGLKAHTILKGVGEIAAATQTTGFFQDLVSFVITTKEAAEQLMDSLRAIWGDRLHQFLDKNSFGDATTIWNEQMKKRQITDWRARIRRSLLETSAALKAGDDPRLQGVLGQLGRFELSDLSDDELFVLCIQIIEGTVINKDNKHCAQDMAQRYEEQAERLRALVPKAQARLAETSATQGKNTKQITQGAAQQTPPTEEEGFWGGLWDTAKEIFGPQKEIDLAELKARLEAGRRGIEAARQAERFATGGISLQAAANGINNAAAVEGAELTKKRKTARRSLSNPDLRGANNLVSSSITGAGGGRTQVKNALV